MYVPRHWHFVMPVSAVLITFGINQGVLGGGFHWDYALLVQLPIGAVAFHWGRFIDYAGVAYQNYVTRSGSESVVNDRIINWHTGLPVDDVPPGGDPDFIPLGREPVHTVPTYNQVAPLPRFDKERYFAFTLVRMHENNFKIDMTETRWVKNWKFSRGEFTSMLDNWMRRGIIERESDKKNSGYAVMKWDPVKLIAQGNSLPSPPPR